MIPAALRLAVALLTATLALSRPLAAPADDRCRSETADAGRLTVCTVDLARDDLRLYWADADGRPYGSFRSLEDDLDRQGLRLALAVNGGMYHADLSPVGLHVENGRSMRAASTADGPGNFHLKPNGVFWIDRGRAGISETGQFLASGLKPQFATQSGPMLLRRGTPHPAFRVGSDSRKIRNGVAVLGGTRVVLVKAETPINFHDFAQLFRDRFGATEALFLDGTISAVHWPAAGRSDSSYPLGPILGVVEARR
ncbi:phosphodiester glycosidase family protein [Prosthecodimorpha staleyi]|uniref:Phosphodiester glycosidase family protein n=1 Tax=Prosthecodimorpha staleyi TaxID=2840188 RepID=A0A947GE15_9HYPH|nr:phosphodiester glycosidase family protein [Prosthecodimorpha staleyi]MBT9290886.1 phosphodiester glycosidase family protein [Prosthecodimorpha staleyi]